MTPSKNPFVAVLDTFRSPIDCFAAVHERPKWAFLPYLLIIVGPFFFWGATSTMSTWPGCSKP